MKVGSAPLGFWNDPRSDHRVGLCNSADTDTASRGILDTDDRAALAQARTRSPGRVRVVAEPIAVAGSTPGSLRRTTDSGSERSGS